MIFIDNIVLLFKYLLNKTCGITNIDSIEFEEIDYMNNNIDPLYNKSSNTFRNIMFFLSVPLKQKIA